MTSNPDLATLRLGNPTTPSAEAVEVARHFPTTLNPTLWCDLRPITLIPPDPFGGIGHAPKQNGFYSLGQFYFYISLRQPLELGHQTTHRYHIAKAAYEQQQWTVMQAELLALIQTYRFFETAAYRRERLKIAAELAEFNELLKTLERRLEANQVPAADVVLARVESRATRQLVKAAQQDYITALTDLRNQMGIPESAGAAEPLGEFTLPSLHPPREGRGIRRDGPAEPARHPRGTGSDRRDQGRGKPGPRPIEFPARSSALSTRSMRRASSTSALCTSRRFRSGTAAVPCSASARPTTTGLTSPCSRHSSGPWPRSARPWRSGTALPSWSRRPGA